MSNTWQKVEEATKTGDLDAAIKLLLREIGNEERRVREGKEAGVGAWAYKRLAIIYRKRKEYAKEVEIIKRFIDQPKCVGSEQRALPGRLARAEQLLAKANTALAAPQRAMRGPTARFVAFDIEIAKVLPDGVDDLKAYRPLGICCAAVLEGRDDCPHLWYSRDTNGGVMAQMARRDLQELVRFLCQLVDDGATIVTWNGLGFDFDILAEESGSYEECRALALNHVDMMFHVVCDQGFGVGLSAACDALGLGGKLGGIQGVDVPRLWKQMQYEAVLGYVANDCRLALDVYHTCIKNRRFEWTTRKGKRSSFPLPHGWLKVCHAVNMPLPDTSWMSNPLSRDKFLGWTSTRTSKT